MAAVTCYYGRGCSSRSGDGSGQNVDATEYVISFSIFFHVFVWGCIQAKKLRPYYQLQVQGDEGVIPFAVAVTVSAMYVLY